MRGVGFAVDHTPGPVNTLVMHQTAGVFTAEEIGHSHNVGAAEGFIAAGPEQNGNVVFIPLEHGFGPVQNAFSPFGDAAGNIPGGIHGHALLPGAVGLQIGFIHHIDAVFVAQVIPFGAVGIVAGADGIDVVCFENCHGSFHIGKADAPAGMGIPFMAVDTVDHEAFAVEIHDLIRAHFDTAEAGGVGDELGAIRN